MIDKRTRDQGLTSGRSGENSWRFETGMQRPYGSVLIWVEGDAKLAREPAAGRHRGTIVVAQGHHGGVLHYLLSPVGTDDHAQHLPAVSGLLEAMGWSALASRRGKTNRWDVNTAALVKTTPFGPEQRLGLRLWLGEPAGTVHDRSAPTHAPELGPSGALGAGDVRTREIRDQLEAWVNEGGAGDDVAS